MTQIRNYAIERLANTIYDDDLLDIQIMEAGADQYEEARMKVSELRKLMNDGVTPKRYKALLSQNEPIATTTDPTMVAGQIWTLEAYNAADAATIAALELVSGTLYAVGSKYRSATNQTLSVDAGTTFSYDGSPYVVSTDVNGNFAPFVNTLGETPTYGEEVTAGQWTLNVSNPIFLQSKVGLKIQSMYYNGIGDKYFIYRNSNTQIAIDTASNQTTPADDTLYYTLIEIEVYP